MEYNDVSGNNHECFLATSHKQLQRTTPALAHTQVKTTPYPCTLHYFEFSRVNNDRNLPPMPRGLPSELTVRGDSFPSSRVSSVNRRGLSLSVERHREALAEEEPLGFLNLEGV